MGDEASSTDPDQSGTLAQEDNTWSKPSVGQAKKQCILRNLLYNDNLPPQNSVNICLTHPVFNTQQVLPHTGTSGTRQIILPQHPVEAVEPQLGNSSSGTADRKRVIDKALEEVPRLIVRIPRYMLANTGTSETTNNDILKKRKPDRIVSREDEDDLLSGNTSDISSGILDRASDLLRTSSSSSIPTDTSASEEQPTDRQKPTKTNTDVQTVVRTNGRQVVKLETDEEEEIVTGEYVETDFILPGPSHEETQQHNSRTLNTKTTKSKTRNKRPRPPPLQITPRTDQVENQTQTQWPLDNTPDEAHRVAKAREILAKPEEAVLWIHPDQEAKIPNSWGVSVFRVQEKVKAQHKITEAEYTISYNYNGYFTRLITDQHTRKEISKAARVRGFLPEIMLEGAELNIPNSVLNGPRVHHFLQLETSWRTQLKGVLVGFEELIYQPENIRNSILNLSETQVPYYPVRTEFENLTEDEIVSCSLYKCLEKKLDLVGKSSTLPFMIEYAPSISTGTWRLEDPIGSFLKVVQHLQKKYSGPMIVLSTPPSYKARAAYSFYLDRKTRSVNVARILHCFGQALGVATTHLWWSGIQCQDGEYIAEGTKRIPLFTAYGLPTQELNNKIQTKLENLVKIFDRRYTSDIERKHHYTKE